MNSTLMEETRVQLSDINIIKGTFSTSDNLQRTIAIQLDTGRFEVNQQGELLMTGFIHTATDDDVAVPVPILEVNETDRILQEKDIYKEFRIRGYNYK